MAAPKMTRAHFQLIADTVAALGDTPGLPVLTVAKRFARELAATNPNFDRERFIAAATGRG